MVGFINLLILIISLLYSLIGVQKIIKSKDYISLIIKAPKGFAKNLLKGASVSVNGVCLTAKRGKTDILEFDVIEETLNKTTLECKKLLNELAKQGNNITLNWVPGHEGHMGNEVADQLAKRGAGQPTHGPGPWVPASDCIMKRAINEWCDVLHEEKWTGRQDCRQSKIVLPSTKHKW